MMVSEKSLSYPPWQSLFSIPVESATSLLGQLQGTILQLNAPEVQKLRSIQGGMLVVCPYQDPVDPILLAALLPRPPVFIGRPEWLRPDPDWRSLLFQNRFEGDHPGLSLARPVLAKIYETCALSSRLHPLEWNVSLSLRQGKVREWSSPGRDLLNRTVPLLHNGETVVYLERHLTEGTMEKARTLPARIAREAQVPVLPVAIRGSRGILSLESIMTSRTFRSRIEILSGDPMLPPPGPERDSIRTLTGQIHSAMERLQTPVATDLPGGRPKIGFRR